MSNPPNQSRNGSHSRLTCEPCRDRKVKCNRVFPSCGRCIRLGFTCSYRDRISQRATQSAIISHLQERVRKQEALLALQSAANKPPSVTLMTTQAPSPSITSPSPHSGPSPSACVEKQRADSGAGSAMAEYNAAWFAGTTFDDSLGSMPTTIDWDMEIMSMRPDGAHITEDWLASTTSGQPLLSTPPAIIAAKDMDELHAIFFARIHPVMPIINEGQFRKDLQDSPHAVAVQSVSCTAALLATTVPEAQASLKQSCYVLARYYVDQCEAEEGFHPSWCMHFLRALLFLTRFEINNRSCARAWLTLGRAIRLAKIMRLDQIDCANEPLFPNVSLPEIVSPAAQTAVELEERRRCLWALYILEGLASIYTGTPGLLDESRLQVSLPSPGELDKDFQSSSLPHLGEAHTIAKSEILSPFCGLVLVVSVLRKVIYHTSQPSLPSSTSGFGYSCNLPGFWDRHFSLLRILKVVEALIEPLSLSRTLRSCAVAFNLHLVFHAVKVNLYEAAIDESERQELPFTEIDTNMDQLTSNALKIATAVRSNWCQQRLMCDNLSLSGAFVGWPLYTAIKALSRGASPDQSNPRASAIRILYDSLDDVEPSDGAWHRLLSQSCPSPRP
ncbi:hypothetical protein ACJQWK_02143 [Exserohilum turcicum]